LLGGTTSELPEVQEIELAMRRWAAAMLRILARWAGPRSAALPLVFDGEARRSLRAIFRGVVRHVPAERRLAGLIPTPTLPERALEALAAAPTAAAAGALLAAWRHPFAAAIVPATLSTQPDLFALETSLARAAALMARGAAARARNGPLHAAVRTAIDLDNARIALLLCTIRRDLVAHEQFLPGGDRLSLAQFEAAVATGDAAAAAARLAAAFVGTPYARAFTRSWPDPAMLEDELLRVHLRDVAREARRSPLGPLPILWLSLRLRAQLLDLQRILWSVALRAPGQRIPGLLTTAA
jgi:hypothetical protein